MNKVSALSLPHRRLRPPPRSVPCALALPLFLLLAWSVSCRYGWMPEQILPAPGKVLRTALELWRQDLPSQLLVSLYRLALGLLAGLIVGTALGAAMGASRQVESLIQPTLYALAQVPTLGWIPLFMVLFGIDDGLKLAVLIKATLVPVTLHTQTGIRNIPPTLLEVARTLRLPWRQRLTQLAIPAALPTWFTGLRLALSQAWVSLIVVELLASSQGIGYLMVWGRQLFQLDIVFVCIVAIGAAGLLMEWSINRLDQRLNAWPHPPVARLNLAPAARRLGLLLPLALLALWQQASSAGWVDPTLLPSPSGVASALWQGVSDGTLPQALGYSLRRALAGAIIGIAAGLTFGVWLGLTPLADALFSPSLSALRQVALFAWLPLLTAWAGNDEAGKITFVALASFFPMLVASQRGVRQRSAQLEEVARVLRLSALDRLRLFILPGAAPAIFAGLRLALIYAWLGTIGAEYFMSSGVGIGSLMINAQQMLDMPIILSGMLLIGLTGALLDRGGQRLEQRVTRWRFTGESA